MEALQVSEAEIMAATTPKGAWTKKTLAKWGVPWPPPSGWKQALIDGKPLPEPVRLVHEWEEKIPSELHEAYVAACKEIGWRPESRCALVVFRSAVDAALEGKQNG